MSDRRETDEETKQGKRKHGMNDVSWCGKKAREDDNGGKTIATEEEVDEFYAILRRIRVAVNYFQKKRGIVGGRKLTEEDKLGLIGAAVECDGDGDGDEGEAAKRKEGVEENTVGFDLNLNPVSEDNLT